MHREPGPEGPQYDGTDLRPQGHRSSIASNRGNLTQRVSRRNHVTVPVIEPDGEDPPPSEPHGGSPAGAKLEPVWNYSKYVMSNIFSIVVAYYSARQDIAKHAEKPSVVVCDSLVFITFLADVILMMYTSFSRTLQRIDEVQYKAAIVLIYVSNVLLMLTPVGLLVLLNKMYAFLAVPLVLPIIAILGILFRKEIRTAPHQRSTGYEDYETELNQFSSLSVSVTFLNITGMMSTISFYFKSDLEKASRFGITVTESFTFLTIILGLLSMLLTTVPPSLNQRERLISVIRALGYVLFGLQTLTGLEVAARFAEGYVVLAFLPDFVGAVSWFHKEFLHERRDGEETGRNAKPDTFAIAVTFSIFGVLMFLHSVNRGGQDYGFHLSSCVLLIFAAFKSSLSWMMLTFRPPETQSLVVANILARLAVACLAAAMLLGFWLIYKFFKISGVSASQRT